MGICYFKASEKSGGNFKRIESCVSLYGSHLCWFLGLTYGVYMNVSGFSFFYPMFMSVLIFAGSMEFVAANLLLGAFNPLQAFLLTLMIMRAICSMVFRCSTAFEIWVLKNCI